MTSTKYIPVLIKQPSAPYGTGSSLGTSETGSAQWKPFKSESLLVGGIGPIVNILGWEPNNALAVSEDNLLS